MVLCTLPADFVPNRDVAYGKHKQLQHSISQMLLVKHSLLTTSTAELTRTDPLSFVIRDRLQKKINGITSRNNIQCTAWTAHRTTQRCLFFLRASKVNGTLKVNKPGTLLGINGFGLRPGAIQSHVTTCSSHAFKKQKKKRYFYWGSSIFLTALLSSHLLKLAVITLVGTCHLYWKAAQPGWRILEGRCPAYLRYRKRYAHCHSCLLTPIFKNKKRVQAQLSLTIQIRHFI